MRILAEEAVGDLCIRLELLGIPIMDESPEKIPLYWKSYLEAVTSGEIAGLEYTRFQKAKELAAPFWEDPYEKTASLQGNDYKTWDYAYALSDLPLPEWFTPL